MPISDRDINKNWVLASPDETVGQVQARLPTDRAERAYMYIVLPAGDGRYVVVRWIEIEQIAHALGQNILGMVFYTLPTLPAPVDAVEQNSLGTNAATELRDQQPGKRLVVLANGQVIGLLKREVLGGEMPGSDPHANVPNRPVVPGIEEEAPTVSATAAADAVTAPTIPQTDTRVINGWIEDPETHQNITHQPLEVRKPYELKFNVDQRMANAIAAIGGVGRALRELAPDQELATLLVVLEPGDFMLYGIDSMEIVVPQAINERSKNVATFTIEAKKEGAGTLKAIYYVNGNLFQKLELKIQVGGQVSAGAKVVSVERSGLTLHSAMALPSRRRGQSVNVTIIAREAGYQVIAQSGGVARAFLNISQAEIAGWLKYARSALKELVHLRDADGNDIYKDYDTFISPEIHKESLKKMAAVGMYLFDELFYGNSGPDARAIGDLLKRLSTEHQLNVQIVAERFCFPWSFLYDGDEPDNPDPKLFWGFKHIIEYLPEFSASTPVNFNSEIDVGDTMDIAFVCENGIDTEFAMPIVQNQREFLNGLAGVNVKDYPNVQDLYTLLKGPDSPPLIYFYCHAVSKFPNEGGGTDDSTITLTDGTAAVRDMKLRARTSLPPLSKYPLIFLNACESAELSPYLYDGLVPYFIARGARGMIGTEVDTPALFAAEFAKKFLARFVTGGVTLGELLRDLRVEYLEQRNNILGLVYALYSSGQVQIQRRA